MSLNSGVFMGWMTKHYQFTGEEFLLARCFHLLAARYFSKTTPIFTNTMGGDPGIVPMGNQLTVIYVGPDINKVTDPRFVMRSPTSGSEIDTSTATQLEIDWMVLPLKPF